MTQYMEWNTAQQTEFVSCLNPHSFLICYASLDERSIYLSYYRVLFGLLIAHAVTVTETDTANLSTISIGLSIAQQQQWGVSN